MRFFVCFLLPDDACDHVFEASEQLCIDHADFVDNDDAQSLALDRQLLLVGTGAPVGFARRYAAPMMHREPIDLRCHCILESQADELNAMPPAQAFLHEAAHPPNDFALPCAWETVH